MSTVSISLPPLPPQTPLTSPSQIHNIFFNYYCYMSVHIHTYAHMHPQLTESIIVFMSRVDYLELDNSNGNLSLN